MVIRWKNGEKIVTLWNKLQRERGLIIYAWDFHTKTSLKEWKMRSEIVKKGGVEELWGNISVQIRRDN